MFFLIHTRGYIIVDYKINFACEIHKQFGIFSKRILLHYFIVQPLFSCTLPLEGNKQRNGWLFENNCCSFYSSYTFKNVGGVVMSLKFQSKIGTLQICGPLRRLYQLTVGFYDLYQVCLVAAEEILFLVLPVPRITIEDVEYIYIYIAQLNQFIYEEKKTNQIFFKND